jgi:hypothetical protein
MLSSGFSSTVLHGMKRHGFTDTALSKITGLTPTRLKSVLAARAGLTDHQLDSVEEASGMTAGELAARHLEPHGGAFTELAAMLADCRSRPLRRSRNTRKRAS